MPFARYINAKPHQQFERDQGAFIRQQVKHLPGQFRRFIASTFDSIERVHGLSAANQELASIASRTRRSSINLAADDHEIRNRAERCAKQCGLTIAASGLHAGIQYAKEKHIAPPDPDKYTEAGQVARLSCERWWRRQLRQHHGRTVEGVAIDLNIVNKQRDIYASETTVQRVRSQRSRNRAMLEACYAVNELGQEYTLAELADLSVSNPVIRRGELMTRIAGMEQYARRAGHVGEFWTITCPSRMHASLSKSGQRNQKFDGTTPRQAHKYLCKQWEKARAAFQRAGIELYGVRVCEPQHDATPHWHTLFFMPAQQAEQARAIMRRYALEVDGNEPGAAEHRFKPKAIDWTIGTAAGYIAKYVAKNIDGFGVEYDLYGKDASASVERVAAWASTWGIRQFQFIGGPKVTAWRELRRIEAGQVDGTPLQYHHAAADAGDWFAYMAQCDRRPVTLLKVWNDKPGRYLEPLGWQTIGVECYGKQVISRVHQWEVKHGEKQKNNEGRQVLHEIEEARIVTKGAGMAESEPTAEGMERRKVGVCLHRNERIRWVNYLSTPVTAGASWSPVNNCTRCPEVDCKGWQDCDCRNNQPQHNEEKNHVWSKPGGHAANDSQRID